MTRAHRLLSVATHWLVRDKIHAAGRVGLYRVFFSLFYLWRLSNFHLTELDDVTLRYKQPLLFTWVPDPPSFGLLECALIVALALQLFGIFTRVATLAVLVLGVWFDICRMTLTGIGLAMFLIVFWVPVVMVFSDWGATYSVDNLLRRRTSQAVDPDDPSGHRFWPIRTVLICLSALYFTAGVSKIKGYWLEDPDFIRNFLLSKGVGSHLQNGAPLNPLVPWIAAQPFLTRSMQYGALIFETIFPLTVVSRAARSFFFRFIPMFHAMNTFLFGILVVEILGVYGAFVDWHALIRRALGRRLDSIVHRMVPHASLIAWLLCAVAVLCGISWNTAVTPRSLFSLGGWLQSYRVWILVTVTAIIWWTNDIVQFSKRLVASHAARRIPQTAAKG
jgi:hypothetical protein